MLTNHSTATLTNSGSIANRGEIVNSGSFTVTSTGTVIGGGSFKSYGTTVVDGTLTQGLVDIYDGTLAGTGTIASPNTILIGADATVTPGALGGGIGTMTMDGDVDFAGLLGIELGLGTGTIPGTDYDFLHITGLLNLVLGYNIGFELDFHLLNPFYKFDFLTADLGIDGFDPMQFSIGGTGSYAGYTVALSELACTAQPIRASCWSSPSPRTPYRSRGRCCSRRWGWAESRRCGDGVPGRRAPRLDTRASIRVHAGGGKTR